MLSPFSTWSGNESTGGRIYSPQCPGAYPLPWGIQTSGNYQTGPGIPITASHVVTNAAIAPSPGRNLAACGNVLGGRPAEAQRTIRLLNLQYHLFLAFIGDA
jgi:hypothetical protein